MAESTLHFKWLVTIKENLETLTEGQDVFVAGDLLWYPVQGKVNICKAPDVMVAIGRPKGDRLSYLQWHEENVAPQVVFEIHSKSDRSRKHKEGVVEFYEQYGVEEFYSYDPETNAFAIFIRQGNKFARLEGLAKWISPLLKIQFEWSEEWFSIYHPDGERFERFEVLAKRNKYLIGKYEEEKRLRKQDRERLLEAEREAETAKAKANEAAQKAEAAERKALAEARKNEAAALNAAEMKKKAEAEAQRAEAEAQRAEAEAQRAEAEALRAKAAEQHAAQSEQQVKLLKAKLRELGINPDL